MNEDQEKNTNTEDLLQNMQQKLAESSSRDKKGRAAIARLLVSENAIHLIEETADKLDVEPMTVGKSLALAMAAYRSGRPINVTDLGNAINPEGVGVRFGREHIIPLAIDLGFIIKTGDRSTSWQNWDKIGNKPGWLDVCKAAIAVTPEKLAVKEAAERAHAERCKLEADRKREAYALKRKEAAMRTISTLKEADELAASAPVPATLTDAIKANPLPAALITVLVIGMGAAVMTTEPQQGHPAMMTEVMAASVNGNPMTDTRITNGDY